jgi:hypothetical protein
VRRIEPLDQKASAALVARQWLSSPKTSSTQVSRRSSLRSPRRLRDDRVPCACASCSSSPCGYRYGCGSPAAPRPGKTPRSGRAGHHYGALHRLGDPQKHGIAPAPRRNSPSWADFLRSQAEAIIACDFFTVDLLDSTRAHVLAVIEHATRRIHILGATTHPTTEWVTQQARNMLMDLEDTTGQVKFLIRDRDM